MNAPTLERETSAADEIAGSVIRQLDKTDQQKIDQLSRDAAALHGRLEALSARQEDLGKKVAAAKGRLALKSELEQALEALQKMAHDRSVGAFERMLTAITRDVQPATPTEIKLELTTERNMPALDIFAEVAGKREGITSGALANIASTGLRFITLARSGRARFMLLDEPDCFIESGDVQNFFNVIDQLSRDAGIQTVLITHHDLSAFEDRFRIYEVSEVDSNDAWPRRLPELVSEGRMDASDLQDRHFTFVEAENFESYTRARIELSPGVTAITGKNGRGKSAWARMLRSLFLGESGDDNVRHGKTALQVAVGFSDGRVLSHHRRLKGAPKGEFIMHTPDSYDYACANPGTWKKDEGAPRPLHHTESARLPEWVPNETGVSAVDGINVALWNQLTPVFMLDQPPSKRASLLSIGRESGHLYAMNELYKEDVRSDNSQVKEGEKEIAAIRALTEALAPVAGVLEQTEQLRSELDMLMAASTDLKQAQSLIEQIELLHQHLAVIATHNEAASGLGAEPEVQRTEGLQVWFERLQMAQEAVALRTDIEPAQEPVLAGVDEGMALLHQLREAELDASLMGRVPSMPDFPALIETHSASELLLALHTAASDSRIPILQTTTAPQIQTTSDLADILSGIGQAQADQRLPALAPPQQASINDTAQLAALLDELSRAQTVINGCKAQTDMLMQESQQIDLEIDRATQVLGAQWELPPERISRLAEQVIQSTSGSGAQQRAVCQVQDLEAQISRVAKEGYSYGLAEGLSRTAAPKAHESVAQAHGKALMSSVQ